MMRLLFMVLFAGGLAVGVIWPWAQRHFGGEEIGNWALYQRSQGYHTAHIALRAQDAPLRIFVDASPMAGATSGQQASVLNLAVSRNGVPVLGERLSYRPKSGHDQRDQPQSGAVIRQSASDLTAVQDGDYEFSIRIVEDGLSLTTARLVLRRAAPQLDETITSTALVAMIAGLYGFMRLRRRRPT